MARNKKIKSVVQQGKKITIDCEGFEFRAEDIGWLNIHRGVLERKPTRIVLTFPNVQVARLAFDEMITLGAGNVDSVPELHFTSDEMQALADSLREP